jgi:branched-chain amino acid transport system ATP-binding protein
VALLELVGLTKRYSAVAVVDDLSFSLGPGEILGVVGPNGAGKTTMMDLIAGITRPDAGRVLFEGRDITALPPHDRCRAGVARTYQVPRPFEGMTVLENVLVGAAYGRQVKEHRERRIDQCAALLRTTNLLDRANAMAGSLTLLQRKRLELARALATHPRLLLLDEIAGGLTDAEVAELIDTIFATRTPEVGIIWIEHIMHALERVADRLMALDAGRKLIEGKPASVLRSEEVQRVYLGVGAQV